MESEDTSASALNNLDPLAQEIAYLLISAETRTDEGGDECIGVAELVGGLLPMDKLLVPKGATMGTSVL